MDTVLTALSPDRTASSKPVRQRTSSGSDMMDNTVKAEIARWIKAVETLDSRQPLGAKYRTYLPLRVGSKPVETHSMHDKGWKYQGEMDISKKPHGSGEVIFR